jgi:nitrilase
MTLANRMLKIRRNPSFFRAMPTSSHELLTVAAVQMAPIWLDRARTTEKVVSRLHDAARAGAQLATFGEALIPGYPFWLERTDGARFESPVQKALHAHYLAEAVQIEAGHLDPICDAARELGIAVVFGCIERPSDRGGHSAYASLVYVDPTGAIGAVHRKLMPTYEERLCWSPGDGHGLRTHALGPFTLGGLNCWENWMPLPRAALYAQGENLHVAIWPGGLHNTHDLTRFIAREGRSYVISVSGLMRRADIPDGIPQVELLRERADDMMANGGSCIAAPDGSWVVEPLVGEERLIIATLDHRRVREERQNFDPSGHYARPDVTQLIVNRDRQTAVRFQESLEGRGGL